MAFGGASDKSKLIPGAKKESLSEKLTLCKIRIPA
jgi:hypothetical protein